MQPNDSLPVASIYAVRLHLSLLTECYNACYYGDVIVAFRCNKGRHGSERLAESGSRK